MKRLTSSFKNILLISSISLALFSLSSCKEQPKKKVSATGRNCELLVVAQQSKWDSNAGFIIKSFFAAPMPGLPQDEPIFTIYQVDPSNFSKLFQTHRNIFILEFDTTAQKPSIEIKRDNWAYPQLIIKVNVKDESTLEAVFEKNSQDFIDRYMAVERERTINAYSRMKNEVVKKSLKDNYKVNMSIPEGYFIGKQDTNFIWIRRTGTRDDLDMGVLLTFYPYKDAVKDFDTKTIVARRDSITKAHIPGQFPNSYMTSFRKLDPETREVNFNGLYAKELRGLWRVEGDFMGGPYVNYTLVDTTNNRLVMLDGFVYSPKFEKRNYIRQVEAILYSIEFL